MATDVSKSLIPSASEVRDLAMASARTNGQRYDIVTVSGDRAYFLHPL